MKERYRLLVLKLFASAAYFCAASASILVLGTWLSGRTDFLDVFLPAAVFSAGMAAGSCARKGGRLFSRLSDNKAADVLMLYKNREEKALAVSKTFLYLGTVLPVLLAVALYLDQGILKTAFEAAALTFVYLLSLKCGLNEAYDILTLRASVIGLVVFILCLGIAAWVSAAMYLRLWVSLLGYVFLLAFLIVRNQEDIDSNIFSGRYVEKSVLPKDMRRYNLKVVLVFFAVILILLNFKIALLLLSSIGDWLIKGLKVLFSLLGDGRQAGELPPETPDVSNNPPFIGGVAEKPEFPLVFYLRNVVISTILMYIIVKLAAGIYRFITKKLISLIKSFFARFFRVGEKQQYDSGGDYDDEIEIEKPLSDRSWRREARARVKKAHRDLKGITDPVERIRCMYAAVLGMLRLKGIGVATSDTVWDIYAKAGRLPSICRLLNDISIEYEKIRYGGCIPGKTELSAVEGCYSEIVKQMDKAAKSPEKKEQSPQ